MATRRHEVGSAEPGLDQPVRLVARHPLIEGGFGHAPVRPSTNIGTIFSREAGMAKASMLWRQVQATPSFLVVVLSAILVACGPQPPQRAVIGEWQRDSNASFPYACDPVSFAIASTGEGTYSITVYLTDNPICGYSSPQVVNAVFMTEMGRSIIRWQYDNQRSGHNDWIYLPEAKKINVNEGGSSYYSRTSR